MLEVSFDKDTCLKFQIQLKKNYSPTAAGYDHGTYIWPLKGPLISKKKKKIGVGP